MRSNQLVDMDLRVWARQAVRQRKRARRLLWLNRVLVPVCLLVLWEVWRAL